MVGRTIERRGYRQGDWLDPPFGSSSLFLDSPPSPRPILLKATWVAPKENPGGSVQGQFFRLDHSCLGCPWSLPQGLNARPGIQRGGQGTFTVGFSTGAGKDWRGAGEGRKRVGELPWHAPSPLGSQLCSVGHSQFLEEEGEQRALGLLPVQAAYSGEVPPRLFA